MTFTVTDTVVTDTFVILVVIVVVLVVVVVVVIVVMIVVMTFCCYDSCHDCCHDCCHSNNYHGRGYYDHCDDYGHGNYQLLGTPTKIKDKQTTAKTINNYQQKI